MGVLLLLAGEMDRHQSVLDVDCLAKFAALVSKNAAKLLAGIGAEVDRETLLKLEPGPPAMLNEAECDEAFLAIAAAR